MDQEDYTEKRVEGSNKIENENIVGSQKQTSFYEAVDNWRSLRPRTIMDTVIINANPDMRM